MIALRWLGYQVPGAPSCPGASGNAAVPAPWGPRRPGPPFRSRSASLVPAMSTDAMIVLGIESSCDETGVALHSAEAGLLAHALHSQVDLHALYGGVVPELASRDHVRRLVPLVRGTLERAGLCRADVGGVAYTAGPGLGGALLTGAVMGRSLAFGLGVPALGVHHMEGHLLSPMLEFDPPPFPFVCLLVSGGHTQLVHVGGVGRYRLLGESVDDAAGEAFDKTAKALGLPYPGGAALSALAREGDPEAVVLPRPMLDRPGLDFSFSGLKTAAIVRLRAHLGARADGAPSLDGEAGGGDEGGGAVDPGFAADLAAGFEAAVVDVLATKCARALEATGLDRLVISGGVSANARLRAAVDALTAERGGRAWYPRLEFCTDNGAMIALVGSLRLGAGERDGAEVAVRPRWDLESLGVPDAGVPLEPPEETSRWS